MNKTIIQQRFMEHEFEWTVLPHNPNKVCKFVTNLHGMEYET
jgi:hypothetical protein